MSIEFVHSSIQLSLFLPSNSVFTSNIVLTTNSDISIKHAVLASQPFGPILPWSCPKLLGRCDSNCHQQEDASLLSD